MTGRQLVLVIDRDRDTLDVAVAGVDLSPAVEVVHGSSAAEARTRLAGRNLDLLIVDVSTVRMDGVPAVEALVSGGEPVLLLVQVESLGKIPDDLLRIASDVLVKPLRTAEARFRMRQLLRSRPGDAAPSPIDVTLGNSRSTTSASRSSGAFALPGGGAPAPPGSSGTWRAVEATTTGAGDTRFTGAAEWTVLLGESEPVRELRRQVALVAPSHESVLLLGEPGTRREVIARALHARSGRGSRPFVTVSAAQLAAPGGPDTAFPPGGGSSNLRALVRAAAGGTLFVPELADLDATGQERLLEIIALIAGAETTPGRSATSGVTTPTRLVASTRRSLARMVQSGSFNESLFYRLLSHPIQVPALRERGRDVLLLARHIAARAAAQLGRPEPPLAPAAEAELLAHEWPGNVRELEDCMTRAVHACSDRIEREHLDLAGSSGPLLPFRDAKRDVVERFERAYAVRALALANGNISAAARLAGKDRKDFWSILRKHGIGISRRTQAAESAGDDPLGRDADDDGAPDGHARSGHPFAARPEPHNPPSD